MTRDPSRIDPILARLAAYWHAHPDLRLGQIVVNAVKAPWPRVADAVDVYSIEDDKLAAAFPEAPSADGAMFTPDQIDSLLGMRDHVQQHADYWRGKEAGDSADEALVQFDRLLAAHGIDPASEMGSISAAERTTSGGSTDAD